MLGFKYDDEAMKSSDWWSVGQDLAEELGTEIPKIIHLLSITNHTIFWATKVVCLHITNSGEQIMLFI